MASFADASAPKHGLPESLRVPIAAADETAIATFVGAIVQRKLGRDGVPVALLVRPHMRPSTLEPNVPLWQGQPARVKVAFGRLHPPLQVWVDVDYASYRDAYFSFGQTAPAGYFLDHVQNRAAIRLRGYSHPWLRLCPVSRAVNTSGGAGAGGEGMEKDYLRSKAGRHVRSASNRIIYADPMDLTKMLDVAPGTQPLDGVRETQALFFPR
jgi:hypothetical protein